MKTLKFAAKSLVLFVIFLLLPGIIPASAAHVNIIYIVDFGANCRDFSIDVRMRGVTDDGNGLDRFRYVIIDGSGAVLYQEDATRPVGESGFAEAINLTYQRKPTANPVIFTVQDVDSTGKATTELQRVRHDVECLKPSGLAKFEPAFTPTYMVRMSPQKITPFYNAPYGSATGDYTGPGNLPAVYRTADNKWIGVWWGGPELTWVPAEDVSPPDMLPIRPTRIERYPVLGQPTGVVIQLDARIHAQPDRNSPTIGAVVEYDPPYFLEVLARTPDSQWMEVKYNAFPGWIDVGDLYYYDLLTGDLLNIPVVPYPGK